MGITKKSNLYRVLLLFVTLTFSSGTIPAFIKSPVVAPIHRNIIPEDSTKIFLFLDTTVLGSFCWPVKGKVISHYGRRGRRMHTGTDIKLAHRDTVCAAFNGVVTKSEKYYGYGILVVLKHPQNLETYYAHLSKALVKDGDTVSYGTPVGLGGRTGRATTDHLHFEIRKNGKPLNSEHFFNFNDLNIKTMVLLKESKKDEKTNEVEEVEKAEKVEKEPATKKKKKKDFAQEIEIEKKYHTIKKGDTLFSLSRRYGTTVDEICKLNHIRKSSILKIGTKLRVQ